MPRDFGGFGGGNGPDPEKIFQSLTRIQAAFNQAAAKPGQAQRHFQALSQGVDTLVGLQSNPSLAEDPFRLLMTVVPVIAKVGFAEKAIVEAAKTDPETAKTYKELEKAIRDEIQSTGIDLLGGLGGALGGGGLDDILKQFGLGGTGGTSPGRTEELPPEPEPRKRRKPGKGDGWKP